MSDRSPRSCIWIRSLTLFLVLGRQGKIREAVTTPSPRRRLRKKFKKQKIFCCTPSINKVQLTDWLSMNVLMLDPSRVVDKNEEPTTQMFKKPGIYIEIVPVAISGLLSLWEGRMLPAAGRVMSDDGAKFFFFFFFFLI